MGNGRMTNSGWWFGCHFLDFPINIGFLSSSQLTNIFQRGGPGPPTSTSFGSHDQIESPVSMERQPGSVRRRVSLEAPDEP